MVIFLAGCRSAPAGNIVNPLDLLSRGRAFYCSVPADFDDSIYELISADFASDLFSSRKSVEMIKKYIDDFYVSAESFSSPDSYEIVVSGDFPSNYLRHSLSKKSGFVKSKIESENLKKSYVVFTKDSFSICIISDNIALISKNIEPMLLNYESQIYGVQEFYDFVDDEFPEIPAKEKFSSDLSDENLENAAEMYEFFSESTKSVKLYASSASFFSSLIKNLFGLKNLKIELPDFRIFQEIYYMEEDSDNYRCDLKLDFESIKFAKTAKTLLNFISPFPDDVIISLDGKKIVIQNIRIEKRKVFEYLN